uniref:hypothetical protein n=1 Tax=uncultured Draconibacterium sp. TaxID=1573823 RepID=UPI00321804E0
MNLLVFLFFTVFSIFTGKPASKTEIYLEKGAHNEVVAFQVTGAKGQVTFKHLDAASYRLLVLFPQQEGKYIKEKPKHQTLTKATYNPKTKTYYFQGTEGYFSIHFSGLSKIQSENFKAVFKEDRDEEVTYAIIAEFGAHKDGASVSLLIKAITAAQFKKAADKIGQDISTQSIRGIK